MAARLKVHSAEREIQLKTELASARVNYLELAGKLHAERKRAAKRFEQAVERGMAEVAMESAKFQVEITGPAPAELADETASFVFNARGVDRVEFHFSANVGEGVKPLAKVASGGEASRLMLVLVLGAASVKLSV